MKAQNEDFFKKWGFTSSQTMPNPYEKDGPALEFVGFESKYVSELEFENDKLKEMVRQYERTIAIQVEMHRKYEKLMADVALQKGTSL